MAEIKNSLLKVRAFETTDVPAQPRLYPLRVSNSCPVASETSRAISITKERVPLVSVVDSGVHGALVVLEPSFTGDTMATALGIPPAKHMIRRHLTAELEALVLPARYSVYCHPEATLDNAH